MMSGGLSLKRVLFLILLLAACAEKKSETKELSADEQAVSCASRTEQACDDGACHPIYGVNTVSIAKEYVGCTSAIVCNSAITCATPKGYATPRFVLSSLSAKLPIWKRSTNRLKMQTGQPSDCPDFLAV
jgi:hypothetical protein